MNVGLNIKTFEDLEQIKKAFQASVESHQYRLLICSGTGCTSANCTAVKETLTKTLAENGLTDKVMISSTGCRGSCNLGPLMEVLPDEVLYTKLVPEDIPALVATHFINGKVFTEKTYFDIKLQSRVPNIKDIEFYKKQRRIVLKNCGMVDCHSIEDYISKDGYYALYKVVTSMTPESVIHQIKLSGLRGRGGAGFPTWLKWESGMKAHGEGKYIICNGDEGDPGAFMDRSVIESVPHSVLEGMMIGGYAIGATKGYAYIRAEYNLAVERFDTAIRSAREAGILGNNIFGSGFNFDIEIRIGAGAFVCGEETALMASIEGERGEPKQKPPFPFQKGLFGRPTIINNVETFANVPPIILNGGEWFAGYGTQNSKGTKVFALAGDINNTGLIEVPMGATLGDIIFDIGGGIPKNKPFKAAQIGGPSGGCITSQFLNIPVDYDTLAKLGTIMGSGGLIAMDEDSCMVDMARFFMDFVQEESCGKCVPCRLGT
ncbi:MAG TPA: hydrogenase, partial [Firmicutes bacterium]|nr:hydrogenase [Bacillota bacterium]